MSSNEDSQRVRRAAVAVALVIVLGAGPGDAGDPNAESNATSVGPGLSQARQPGLTLRDALALALKQSPDLAAFSWETRAREARALQAGLLPNPSFSAEVENIGGSGPRNGVETAETTLLLSQLIELGGKRSKRRSLGELEVKVAEWEYEAARLEVISDTTAAFLIALAGQEAVRFAEDQTRLAEGVLSAVQAQARAGAVPAAEVPRAQVEVTKQEIQGRLRVRALRAAYVRLATTWGDSEPGFPLRA